MTYKMKFTVGDLVTDGRFKMKVIEIFKIENSDDYFYKCVPVDDSFYNLLAKEESEEKLGRIIPEKILSKC